MTAEPGMQVLACSPSLWAPHLAEGQVAAGPACCSASSPCHHDGSHWHLRRQGQTTGPPIPHQQPEGLVSCRLWGSCRSRRWPGAHVSCVQLVQAGGEEIEALTISPLPLTGMIPRRVSWMAGSCTATSLAVDCAGPEVSPTPVVGKRKLAYSCPILECLCSRDCQIVQLLSSSIFNPNLRTKLLAYSVRYKNACCLQRKES